MLTLGLPPHCNIMPQARGLISRGKSTSYKLVKKTIDFCEKAVSDNYACYSFFVFILFVFETFYLFM